MRNTSCVLSFLLCLTTAAHASPMTLDQRGDRATMLERVAWVRTCLGERDGAVAQILCVAEPLDVSAADREIDAALDLDADSRARQRELVRAVYQDQARSKQRLGELATQEPAITRLLAIAEHQRREWTEPTPARATLIALVEQMEAATASHERSAFDGCERPTRTAWTEIVRSRRLPAVSTLAALRDEVFLTPEAYLAHRAFALCIAGRGPDGTALLYVDPDEQRRGWRTTTLAAWRAASARLRFISPALRLDDALGDRRPAPTSDEPPACETIAALTPTATGMRIDLAARSLELDAALADGLAPGMRLVIDHGVPIAATAEPASRATWVFGVALGPNRSDPGHLRGHATFQTAGR